MIAISWDTLYMYLPHIIQVYVLQVKFWMRSEFREYKQYSLPWVYISIFVLVNENFELKSYSWKFFLHTLILIAH